MHGFQHPQGERFAFEHSQLLLRQDKADGRADLDDIRIPRIEVDGGKVQTGKLFLARIGDEAVDGREHRLGGHLRLIKAFEQGQRAVGNVARLGAAAHPVRKRDEEAPLVDLQDGVSIPAPRLALLRLRRNAERRVEFGLSSQHKAGACGGEDDLFRQREGHPEGGARDRAQPLGAHRLRQGEAHGDRAPFTVHEHFRA